MATSRRVGNYATSANAVIRNSDAIFDAAMSGKPDFTKISKEAIKGRSLERRAVTKAEADVASAGLKAFTDVNLTRMREDTKKEIADIKRPAKRMAGIVGGLGAIAGGYVMMEGNKKDKADRDELRAYRGQLDAKADVRDAERDKRDAKILEFLKGTGSEGGSTLDLKPSTPAPSGAGSTNTTPLSSSSTPKSGKSNWGALSSIIRTVEGTTGDKGYTTRFGGHQFNDLSRHPNVAAPTPWGTKSEAAGAYQFMKPTWDEAKSALGLTDFSRDSQEKAGRFLTNRRGVNPDTRFNNFEEFSAGISKLSPEWAGLPNSQKGRTGYHGQANADMQQLWTQYQGYFN
jgi:muramidase (phage lysozyme)